MLVLTLIALTLLIFAVTMMISPYIRATLYVTSAKQLLYIDEVIKKYGLTDPFWDQYGRWMSEILKGNLGWSQTESRPVFKALLQKLPATVELIMFSIPITILVGIFLGIKSAEHRDKPFDHAIRTLSFVGYSLPAFWLSILLLAVFFVWLGWFSPHTLGNPAQMFVNSGNFIKYTGLNTIDGLLNGQLWITLDALRHLVLPVTVLTICNIVIIVTVSRSSMLEILKKRYIAVTTAKDLTQNEVTIKRMRVSALFPLNTLLAFLFGNTLIGIILTEAVFSLNGLGRCVASAVIKPDVPTVIGFMLFAGLFFVIASFIIDIAYACVDPRIRQGS